LDPLGFLDAEAFPHLALAPSTTGCVLTVDGGNIRASPRERRPLGAAKILRGLLSIFVGFSLDFSRVCGLVFQHSHSTGAERRAESDDCHKDPNCVLSVRCDGGVYLRLQ
jgi:hypothetical protein